MANNTADTDWIDCHDLRRDEEARGNGSGERGGQSGLGTITLVVERCTTLRLIEPDGTETEVPIETQAAPAQDPARQKAAEAVAAAKALEEEESRAAEDAAKAARAKAKAEAEAKAKREAEEKAKAEAEAEAKAEAEKKARVEAERKAREEAEAKAKAEAEEKARKAAEEKARKEAEAKARKEAEEKAKAEAERKAKEEAARKAREEAEKKAKEEAERKAREEAEAKAKKEAEEKARREAAAKAKKEAEEKARREAEAKAKKEAEEKAKREAEAKAKKEAEEKAKREAAEKAKAEAEARAEAEAERKAREQAERKAKAEAEARAKAQAEEKARKAAEEKAKREAEKKAAADAAKAEKEAKAKARDLGKTFRRLIRETGPISLAHYMAESNMRYYTSRDPLGEDADFITAPEVSQMFGELIGLWLADLWVRMGSRKRIHYVELGPGRGTLASDALRTAARYEFAPQIHFVETSPALRKIQLEAFPDVQHHDDLSTLPDDAPLLIVANEFFDALPIHQLIRSADGWHERMVGLEGDDFVFLAGDKPMDSIVPRSWKSASQGTMIETSAAASTVMQEIAGRLKEQGGAALIIDYGAFELRAGSTLQAIRNHEKVDVFAHPGQADLTAHVDFEMLKDVASKNGADVMGLQMQGEWLRQMGIETRLEALQRKNPAEKDKLRRQFDRLVDDGQMGALFKVLGICGRRWPIGVGFD
ncbi:class I SAM-dependent methyltransferase [Erythrobacter sp. KY5]|uniref:class I SAM-dependent methyltransferase n=1 Tax=Erythrobacter sp. KY5 TaxID=2011159 RepID=UPI002684B90C